MTSQAATCRLCGGPAQLIIEREDVRLYRCACGFVSGFAVGGVGGDEYYDSYHAGPASAAPVERYAQWLGRLEQQVGQGALLEIGAGSGGFARVARERGFDVTATEVSESGLARLRESGIRALAGEIERLKLPSASFDCVVSLEVLEHVPRPAEHVLELGRILRPGGALLLTTPSFNGLSRRMLGLRWRVIDPEHVGYFTPRTLARELGRAGFTRIRVGSRGLDVTAWRAPQAGRETPCFDAARSAALRERVNGSTLLRGSKEALNVVLGLAGLGDGLVAWARRSA